MVEHTLQIRVNNGEMSWRQVEVRERSRDEVTINFGDQMALQQDDDDNNPWDMSPP
jgi:hypothetical protein